jgi:rsbT co-antagonist protein RsbR
VRPNGAVRWIHDQAFPIVGEDGQVARVVGVAADITERKEAEVEQQRLQDEIVRAQERALAELSTPLIPITDEIVVIPLIGNIDGPRTEQFQRALLTGLENMRARTAIVDVTGVPVVDEHVANALLQAAQAARLLGADVVLTGIRPQVAQTLVGLGVNMRGIVTQTTLQNGIAHALQHNQRRYQDGVSVTRF